MTIPEDINLNDIIRRIESFGAKYDHASELSALEQLEICEALAEAQEEYIKKKNKSISVKWNENGISKRGANLSSTKSKKDAISLLKDCDYKTPPIRVAQLLEQLFYEYNSKPGHWLFIAQHWNPRAINRVIAYMIKEHNSGAKTIQNPAAYFTELIKFRKRRRGL